MVLEEKPAPAEEEESDDEAIDMEVSLLEQDLGNYWFGMIGKQIIQDFVESGKLEEDTGVVEPSVEVGLRV